MFNSISWPQYLGAVAVLLVAYYAYVALVYYRVELAGLMKGKNKAVASTAGPVATPSPLLGNSPLIPKAAILVPVAAAPQAAPEETDTEQQDDSEEQADEHADESNALAVAPPTEETDKQGNVEEENPSELNNDEITSSTAEEEMTAPTAAEHSAEAENEEPEMDFTVGVAQLNHYFDRAAAGEITQQQIEQEVPELENTDLLVAFYKTSTKAVQELTSRVYAEVAEPVIG
jgi:hypothetical protein